MAKLATPSGIKWEGAEFEFPSVPNAVTYEGMVYDGQSKPGVQPIPCLRSNALRGTEDSGMMSFELSQQDIDPAKPLHAGLYEMVIKAKAGPGDEDSDLGSIQFEIKDADLALLKAQGAPIKPTPIAAPASVPPPAPAGQSAPPSPAPGGQTIPPTQGGQSAPPNIAPASGPNQPPAPAQRPTAPVIQLDDAHTRPTPHVPTTNRTGFWAWVGSHWQVMSVISSIVGIVWYLHNSAGNIAESQAQLEKQLTQAIQQNHSNAAAPAQPAEVAPKAAAVPTVIMTNSGNGSIVGNSGIAIVNYVSGGHDVAAAQSSSVSEPQSRKIHIPGDLTARERSTGRASLELDLRPGCPTEFVYDEPDWYISGPHVDLSIIDVLAIVNGVPIDYSRYHGERCSGTILRLRSSSRSQMARVAIYHR